MIVELVVGFVTFVVPVLFFMVLFFVLAELTSRWWAPVNVDILKHLTVERSGGELARLYEITTGRRVSFGALYSTMRVYEGRGWVVSRDTYELGGRVRYYTLTPDGERVVRSLDEAS